MFFLVQTNFRFLFWQFFCFFFKIEHQRGKFEERSDDGSKKFSGFFSTFSFLAEEESSSDMWNQKAFFAHHILQLFFLTVFCIIRRLYYFSFFTRVAKNIMNFELDFLLIFANVVVILVVFVYNSQLFVYNCQLFVYNCQLFVYNSQLFVYNSQLFVYNHQLIVDNNQLFVDTMSADC